MGRRRGLDRWVVAVVVVGGCIPAPVLRVRDGAAEASADAADAARDEDAGAQDVTDLGLDAADVIGADVADVPAPQEVFDGGAAADVTDAGAIFTDHVDATTDLGSCDPGFALRGGACVAVTTARPLWPMSTQTATHRRPLLRWRLGAESDGARVEVCRDRACATVVTSFVATGAQGQPALDLPPGPLFWRVWSRAGGVEALRPSVSWQVYVPWRSGAVNTAQRDTVDVNGDGYADVVVAVPERREVRVYFGSAMGPRAAMVMTDPFIDPATMSLARAGDTNGDGRTDLIVRYGLTSWRVLYGTTGGYNPAMSTELWLGQAPVDAGVTGTIVSSIGDVNGDGYTDTASASIVRLPESITGIHFGSSAGPSMSPRSQRSTSFFSPAPMGDLNADGNEDVVAFGVATVDAGIPTNLVLQGGEAIESWQVISALPNGATVSYYPEGRFDFNGDRSPDVLFRPVFSSDRVVIALGISGILDSQLQFASTVGGRTSAMCAGDFNGDGFSDAAINGSTPGEVLLYRGTPQGLTTPSNSRVTFRNGYAAVLLLCPGDIDGDGFSDIIGVAANSGEARLAYARGSDQNSIAASTSDFDVFPLGSPMGYPYPLQ